MSKSSLYLIDGHSQIYRAYYAPFGNLTSPTGEPTRAIHVFVQMLLNLLRDRKPTYLAVALDVSDETVFRVDIDPTYKAHRDPPPEDLPPQIDRIIAIVSAMGIPILRKNGFEADDLLATLAARHAGPDMDVFFVSRDKDLDQLLNDHIRLYDPAKDIEIDAAAVVAEKGYGPELAVEAQMLMGDSTDNVVGVHGVGPKKAAQLLQKYGSVAGIIAHADELTPKLRENILAFRDRMETVRQLVTLRRDVPIEFDLAIADTTRFNPAAAEPILRELGLNRLLERIGAARIGQPIAQAAPTQSDAPAPSRSKRTGRTPAAELFEDPNTTPNQSAPALPPATDSPPQRQAADTLFDMRPAQESTARYQLVDTEIALHELAKRLTRAGAFAFDTETTALNPSAAKLVGISVAWADGEAAYVPVLGVGRTLPLELVRSALGPIFADARIKKCGQNLKYDLTVLHGAGFEVNGVEFDSMIASFVLDSSRRSHGIDALAADLLGIRKIATHDLIGSGKNQTTFDQLPTDRVCEYAAEDADVAWRLRGALGVRLTDPELKRLFDDIEMPLVEVLARMEQAGVALDQPLLAKMSEDLAARMTTLEHAIHDAAGRPFNINSTQQLAEVLFDERKLPVIKRTKTLRSTDADVLEQLAERHDDPIPKLLLEYRELAKLKGTYIDSLPEMINPRTGRVHPSFHQTGAVTGRLSCSDPNLQNIPIRTELGAAIRRAFVPSDAESVLVKADYSQIELRVLAHFCKDENLIAAFREDRDIHAFVAAQLAGVPIEQVTKDQRARAKTVNFGIVYGQSAFGLARQTGMSQTEAKRFIEQYFARYPRIRAFLNECIAHAKKHGFVKTLLGRRRAISDIASRNPSARAAAERFAVNTVVQGTAADLIKLAMIRIDRRIREERRTSRMILQVHDELVFEVPKRALRAEADMIAGEMSAALALDVPIKVDVAAGPNWLDVSPIE